MALPDIPHILALLQQGETADAAEALERRAARVPAHATTHVLLALAYEADGRTEEAAAAWQEAYFLMPNSPVVQEGRQRVLYPPVAPGPSRSQQVPPQKPEPQQTELQRAEHEKTEPQLPPEEDPYVDLTQPAPPPAAPEAGTLGEAEEEAPSPPDEQDPFAGLRQAPEAGPWETLQPTPGEKAEAEPVDEESGREPFPDMEEGEFGDLDRLIEELESARIVPGPDVDTAPLPELQDEIEDVVSETLARIYAAQQQFDEAARVYELLAAQHPDQKDEYLQKAAEMRTRAAEE